MASERKGGLGTAAASLLRPTTPPEPDRVDPPAPAPIVDEEEQGGEAPRLDQDPAQAEGRSVARSPRRRKAVTAAVPTAKLEGRRLYLSESTHFRLRMLAYQRGRNLSEVAEELLDKALPKWDVSRVG